MSRYFALHLAATLCATLAPFVFAAPAVADQLLMKNGDVITGDIKHIWDGEITIDPAYADEFKVKISAVKSVDAKRDFELDLVSGRSVTAQFRGADENGQQLVALDGEVVALPLSRILELQEPEDYFDWKLNTDISVAVNKGNTDSENGKLKADGQLKIGDHRHLAELVFNRESQDGVTTKEQDLITYNYNWLFRDPWFLGVTASGERDPIRDLDHRIIGAASIGRDIWRTPQRLLNFQIGIGGQDEKIGNEREASSVALWQLRFQYNLFGDRLETFHNHSLTTTLSGRSNTVLKTSTGLRFEVTDLLYTTTQLDYDYESDPADLARNEDIALLFGFGVEFD